MRGRPPLLSWVPVNWVLLTASRVVGEALHRETLYVGSLHYLLRLGRVWLTGTFRGRSCFSTPSDAGRDGLFAGGAVLCGSHSRSLDGVCGLESLDAFGEVRNAGLRYGARR